MQEKVSAQYRNEIEMAKAQRDFELKKAAYDVEVNTKKAESEMAYQLQVLYSSLSTVLSSWGRLESKVFAFCPVGKLGLANLFD